MILGSDRKPSADRLGREHDTTRQTGGGVEAWGKSAMQETDCKTLAQKRFAAELVEKLSTLATNNRLRRLVVVADPASLDRKRASYGNALRSGILEKFDKDLTNASLDEIEAVLKAAGGR